MNAPVKIEKPERPMFAAGWHPDISNEDYHRSVGYSSSQLKKINEMPYSKMMYQQRHPKPRSEVMILGDGVHVLTMEGQEKFDSLFAVRPEGLTKPTVAQLNAKKPSDKTLKQIEDWLKWEEKLEGKTELTHEQMEHVDGMSKSLLAHPQIGEGYFNKELGGVPEQSIFYWYNPEDWDNNQNYRIMCKVRPDWIVPGHPVIFDLKTTRDATETGFSKTIKKLSYHLSAAMYLDGANRCKEFKEAMQVNRFSSFVWILVENEPPYEARSFELTSKDFEDGNILYHSGIRRLEQYKKSTWKGYGMWDGKEYQPITMPIESPNWNNPIV